MNKRQTKKVYRRAVRALGVSPVFHRVLRDVLLHGQAEVTQDKMREMCQEMRHW